MSIVSPLLQRLRGTTSRLIDLGSDCFIHRFPRRTRATPVPSLNWTNKCMTDSDTGAEHDWEWRGLTASEFGLSAVISDCISASDASLRGCVRSLRASPALLIFSDYGGAHKGARFEVMSFLITTPQGISVFLDQRQQLRESRLGTERRMAYKALGDKVRLNSLPAFLDAADHLAGLLICFAIDKAAAHRLSEGPPSDGGVGQLGSWAPRAFRKLTMIGHLAGILVQGVRRDRQDLLWITDEDEIAPNPDKHAESTRIFGHLLNCYCSGPMGHFRFGTTASDPGDLHIEDLAAVPDLAAGCLADVLTCISPHPESPSVERLYVPTHGGTSEKARHVAEWLADAASPLTKLNVVVDERDGLCSVRHFSVVTDLREL